MLASLLGRRFWILAYAMIAAGLWLPGDYERLRPLIAVFLGGILFFASLKIPLGRIADEVVRPHALRRSASLAGMKLIVIPLVAWMLALVLVPDWALGVLLVCLMPAGLSSTAFADLYRANVPLTLVLIAMTSILCPLTVPLTLSWIDPATPTAPSALAARAGYILVLLATPFALAQLVRWLAPSFVARHHHRWGLGAILSSCLLIFVSIAASRGAWASYRLSDYGAPLVAACLGALVAVLACLAVRRWLSRSDAAAMAFTCIWVNNALAIAFADRFYHGQAHMLLPAVLMQVPMIAGVAWYGRGMQAWAGDVALPTAVGPLTSGHADTTGVPVVSSNIPMDVSA